VNGDLRSVAAVATLALCALSACAPQQSDSLGGLPAGGSASSSGYQRSYAYDPDTTANTLPGAATLDTLDPFAARIHDNQTVGFGAGQRLIFNYQQQFDCVVQPSDDRNYNGKEAALDPKELYTPECQVGAPSTIDPTGASVKKSDPLYVLVPFFETNKKTPAFTKALGQALKKLFGFVPDAFKPDPGVAVQCPTPKDKPGSCTMHPLQTDLGPLLTALGLLPQNTNLYVPLVNHDHLLADSDVNQTKEWWQVIVLLVEDPKAWPNAQGTSGITSVAKLQAAQQKKQASANVATNFFLYFNSKAMAKGMNRMPGM
jgi:hypothetical protein